MKLLQARRLELKIMRKNGLTDKFLYQTILAHEIVELIHACEKLFLKFKKSKLQIDEENYKKVKYQVQNLIRKKKREFLILYLNKPAAFSCRFKYA